MERKQITTNFDKLRILNGDLFTIHKKCLHLKGANTNRYIFNLGAEYPSYIEFKSIAEESGMMLLDGSYHLSKHWKGKEMDLELFEIVDAPDFIQKIQLSIFENNRKIIESTLGGNVVVDFTHMWRGCVCDGRYHLVRWFQDPEDANNNIYIEYFFWGDSIMKMVRGVNSKQLKENLKPFEGVGYFNAKMKYKRIIDLTEV